MKLHKILNKLVSLLCVVSLLFSLCSMMTFAVTANAVTATTSSTVKQGNTAYCYVYIDTTEGLAALDVTIHYDPAKVKITNVYNSISCTLYDSVTNTDNIQFSYILDGKGTAAKTQLFYFVYQVLSGADVGDAYFDITIGEAYDASLNEMAVSGSRCSFTIAETVTNKSCSVYGSSSISTAVEQQFTLNYQFSTYQIASGTAVITYDPELFEVVGVTQGAFLTNKVVDINADLTGQIYISFVGTEYYSDTKLVSVTFKTIKNVTETSKIVLKATELIDKELNAISCSGYTTNVNIAFDDSYAGDAPAMWLDGVFSYEKQQIVLTVSLEADSHLGAGDFIITFDPELVSYNSSAKGFAPSFFNINDKNAGAGVLKFHIISLSDIVTEETVLTVVFDIKCPYSWKSADFTLEGTGLTDSLTEDIQLNFVGDTVEAEYKVTFLDVDGSILQTDLYHYADAVTAPTEFIRNNGTCAYYIQGWDKKVAPCTGDATYMATGGTMELLTDATINTVVLKPGVTLDLNGHTLTANLLVAMNGAMMTDGGANCIGGGLLRIDKENLALDKDNGGVVPVWNGVDGYVFTKVTYQQLAQGGEGAAQYIFLPAFSNTEAAAWMADGGTDNGLKFKVGLTWSDGQCQQFYTYSDDLVKQVFDGTGRWVFSLTVTGIVGISDMEASAIVIADCGTQVAATGTELTVK